MEKGQIKNKRSFNWALFLVIYLWYIVVLPLTLSFCVGIIFKETILFAKLSYWDDTIAKSFNQTLT